MKKLVGLLGIVAATGCAMSSESDAINAAHKAGWTDVSVTDSSYSFFGITCQEGEMGYEISGKNPAGQPATATMCCGYTTLKGCTPRY